jgi:hypothetical protein
MHSNEQLLENISPDGGVPQCRIKDPQAAKALFDRLYEADKIRRKNRASAQAMLDGVPPYDEAELAATGQSEVANINFGEGEQLLEEAMAGYVDLLSSVERLVALRTTYGDKSQRYEWEQIIAEEITRMLRAWPRYTSSFLLLANYFVGQGVGVVYHEDEIDWRWRVTGLGDFLIPNHTYACEEEIEVAICRRSYQVHQLYAFIRDEQAAAEAGWCVEEVRKAILEATSTNASINSGFADWEALQAEFKNNDLMLGYAASAEVRVLHIWNREFDGSISHTLTMEDGSNEKFLCYRKSPFTDVAQAFTIFTYGIGTNGYYHSIRGLAHKVFPHVEATNRLRGRFFDGSMLASSMLIQPENEEALQDIAMFYYGPYAVVPPGAKVVERATANFAQSVVPMLNDLTQLIQDKTGSYRQSSSARTGLAKTKFEVQVDAANGARLSAASLNLFYDPLQRHLREVVRRITRRGYLPAEPGGREVLQFRKRCLARGVPEEAIYRVDLDTVVAVRAVGSGSEVARLAAFEEFIQLMSSFDDAGRRNVLRDRVAARVGYDQVDRYVPPIDADARPMHDQKIAELENNSMRAGYPIEAFPNENHLIHARTHAALIQEYIGALDQGQMPLETAAPSLVNLVNHQTQHVERLGEDGAMAEEAAMLRKQLQETAEFTFNGMEKLRKQQQQQQAEAAQQPPQQQPTAEGGQPPKEDGEFAAKIQRQAAETQAKIEMMRQLFSVKQSLKIAEFRQKAALADAQQAARMSRENNFGL